MFVKKRKKKERKSKCFVFIYKSEFGCEMCLLIMSDNRREVSLGERDVIIPIPAKSIKRLLEDERRADQKKIP